MTADGAASTNVSLFLTNRVYYLIEGGVKELFSILELSSIAVSCFFVDDFIVTGVKS